MSWKPAPKETINNFFDRTYNQKPDRYGASYIFEVYDLNNEFDKIKIDQDLEP